jgi:peptidoglycan/LPS O-acetylase OafA/YrhL
MTHLECLGDRHAGDDTAAGELAPVDGHRREDAGDPGASQRRGDQSSLHDHQGSGGGDIYGHRSKRQGARADTAAAAEDDGDPSRQRLAGLDGVRGLAALFVVVNHVFLRAFPGYPVDRAPLWAGWFIYGRFAVVVFIVLSGFSLALSPARHGWRLDGVSRFALRRARRILPPYWAALVFSLAVAWLVVPPPGQGAPNAKSVVVNGLLVQNLVGAPSPNRSFWSIAVEAQLYVVFPLLLLMVRRWGAIVMVATVTLVVATVGILGPHVARLNVFVIQSPPDLAALFAVGVLAAGIVGASGGRRSWPWAWLALAAAAPVIATIWWQGSVWTLDHLFWVDLTLGPAVGCLLAGLVTGHPAPLLRLLDARPMRNLGSSSYSLYLTHGPIVVLVYELIVAGRVRQGVPAFLVSLALVVPLTIVFARVFASVFEIPFRRPLRQSLHTV